MKKKNGKRFPVADSPLRGRFLGFGLYWNEGHGQVNGADAGVRSTLSSIQPRTDISLNADDTVFSVNNVAIVSILYWLQ